MIDFLNKYGLSKEDILEIKGHFDEKFIYNLGVMKNNVIEVLDYLQSIGVTNFKNLILGRCDLCFMDVDYLKGQISKYDEKLIVYVMNNDICDLLDFDIQYFFMFRDRNVIKPPAMRVRDEEAVALREK